MAQRSFRPWLALALTTIATAIFLPACWNAGGLGPLFGGHNGSSGSGGFNPGTGGGVLLKDLFVGARLQLAAPSVQITAPANGAKDVSTKTPIAVQFSESMLATLLRNGVQLFAQGSSQSTPASISFFNGDSIVALVPTADLLPATQYQISVAGSLTDLQGEQVPIGNSKGSDLRFSFTTIAATGDPAFEVIYSSPAQEERNVPRGTEAVLEFSEPFNASVGPGGINAPGAVTVKVNGTTLVVGTDYQVISFPSANPRAIDIHFTVSAPADAVVDVIIDKSVQNADGRKTLKGGNGFTVSYTTQDAAIPTKISFPSSPVVQGKDGAVAAGTLHAFPADVDLTADGITPDTTTIIYFDPKALNALIFSAGGANPTHFTSDLQPQSTPALADGDVLVGSYIERRSFRSEVSVVETIVKDTIGPRLLALGPPGLATNVLLTQVNDPVIHGRMSEPCAGVAIDFDGAGVPDFNSVQFTAGQSTVTDDFFVTGASVDAPLSDAYEGNATFSFICSDLFGNGAVNQDQFVQTTAGKLGASVKQPDGQSALYVVAYAGDTFDFLAAGAVLLDAFPPEVDGLHQIVKGLAANFGVVRFTDAELASIPTSQITVTIVAQRGGLGSPRILLGPVTFTGVNKPSAASPKAIAALLAPDAQVDLNNNARCVPAGASANSPTFSGSAFSFDILPGTSAFDRSTPMVGNPTPTQNLLDLPLNQLQLFTLTETVSIGTSNFFRFTSSEPFTSDPPPNSSEGPNKSRTADFSGRTQFDSGSHPELVHTLDFDDDQVSYDKTQPPPGLPGPIGLRGSSADQLRQLSIICRLPGFVDECAVSTSTSFTSNAPPDFTGQTLLPLSLLQNNSVSAGVGFEDSPLELLLQPALIDPAVAVDLSILKRNLRLEMMVQDNIVFGTTIASSAYTRQRFVFDATAPSSSVLAPQSVPTPTVVNTAHPPVLQWNEVTNGEGMHLVRIISVLQLETWKIYVAAGAGPTVSLQVPHIPTSLPDGLGLVDFAQPGTFQGYVESFDFDPNHIYDNTTPEQYNFDPQSFWQSDLEREFLRSSRSDPNFVFTTH
jgi:Big-like domain-containing protein